MNKTLTTVLFFLALNAFVSVSGASLPSVCAGHLPSTSLQWCSSKAFGGGHESPFPLETQIPFPWNSIRGMYELGENQAPFLVSLTVHSNSSSDKVLHVNFVSRTSQDMIASGEGLASPNDKLVRAIIRAGDVSYFLVVEAFRPTINGLVRDVTVLSMRPLNNNSAPEQHFVLRKIGDVPF